MGNASLKKPVNKTADDIAGKWLKQVMKHMSGKEIIKAGISLYIKELAHATKMDLEHIKETPNRFVKALDELFEGCEVDPALVLKRSFSENKYDQLIIVREIDFVSMCAHHLLPFIGKVHFGYLPDKKVVGLSKIPRMIEILAHRPQIQESLSQQIVEVFQEVVKPRGCAVVMSANHMCMSIRGVKKAHAMTDTIALEGTFKTNASLKAEFLAQVAGSR